MAKIKFETLTEAVIVTNNSVDTEKVYDIAAKVRIYESANVSSVNSDCFPPASGVRVKS